MIELETAIFNQDCMFIGTAEGAGKLRVPAYRQFHCPRKNHGF
ncbi:hypothetical protein [Pseudomonas sp. RIT-PI-r]|nr:hypothetical protein [Pseudomonas sp. RIT-PI-r]